MYQLILLFHVFAAICIIGLVLIQQGKGATVGAAFGSGASQTVFGSRGSGSFLFRVTVSLVAVFFITSLSLNYLVTHAYKQEKAVTLPVLPENKNSIVNKTVDNTAATNNANNNANNIAAGIPISGANKQSAAPTTTGGITLPEPTLPTKAPVKK